MAHGLQVFNASDFIQVDENLGNLQVVASGTTAAMGTNTEIVTALPSATGPDSVVFVRPTDNVGVGQGNYIIFWGWIDYANDEFTIGRELNTSFYQGTYDYIVCTPSLTAPVTGYGLNVYTAAGDLAYASDYDTVECVEVVNFALTNSLDTFTFDANSAGWATGDRVYDFYVLLNAMGKVGRVANTNQNHYYTASGATYKYDGGINPDPENIKIGVNGFVAPIASQSGSTIFSVDSRCQIFAKYIG